MLGMLLGCTAESGANACVHACLAPMSIATQADEDTFIKDASSKVRYTHLFR